MLADPYRIFDCCIETDGAAAVVVTTVERARDLAKKPITIMGAAAVTTGMANYVLIPAGWNGYSGARVKQTVSIDAASLPGGAIARDFYLPFGLTVPPQWYSLIARRHMHEFGTTAGHLVYYEESGVVDVFWGGT